MHSRSQKNRIYKLLKNYNDKLVDNYINEGPSELRKKLKIESDDVWEIVFDYLVFEKDIVKICVKKNITYIHDIFAEKGPEFLRSSFQIESVKYEDVWEYIMDYIGISRGALYEYVANNLSDLKGLIYYGKSSKIRENLCIDKYKYNRVWEEVLDMLLESVSTDAYTYSMYEQGLRMFTRMYHSGRKHRSLKKSESIEITINEEEEEI